jgi:anti-sigma factor RsiW
VTSRTHLSEQRLFDCYLVGRAGEPIDPRAAEHLADCAECRARYDDLTHTMDALRHEADVETAAVFTADRLRGQQQQIMRRVEHVGRPARVLDFPRRVVSRHMNPSGANGLTRWVYAAAAAGLVIGVGLGAVYQADRTSLTELTGLPRARHVSASQQLGTPHVRTSLTAATPSEAADDAFLSDLEVALERPHTPSLQSFDALTPHARDAR